jgi:RimJ/RimL family protein N-acetyltransferase
MNKAPTIIINEELLIRKPRETDVSERFEIGRSLEFVKMVGGSTVDLPPYEYDNAQRLYQRELKNEFSWFIEYRGKMIGVCRLRKQESGAVRYSIGIYDDSLYSKGIGTKVTNAVMEFAFNELNLIEVELMVLEYNKRAIRCYEKCGFKITKIIKDSLDIDGELYNDIIMKTYRKE